MKLSFSAVAFCFLFSTSGFSSSLELSIDRADQNLPHFFEVVAHQIYRGAQPLAQGFKELADLHIKTVLDLRNEGDPAAESKVVTDLGMNFISVPLSGFSAPKDSDMELIQSILTRPDLQPLFVHCKLGRDRTGLAIGLYRVFEQHYTPQVAYAEMKERGFHEGLIFLKRYFDKKTGR